MTPPRLPVFYVSHGGGPWPWMPEMRSYYRETEEGLARIGKEHAPKAVLIISAHWEERDFTVSSSPRPRMIYDYGGFPADTYQIKYEAPGLPELSKRVVDLAASSGIRVTEDPARGFDHGVFVPLFCIYPEASVPVVQLSMKKGYSPAEHFALGASLEPLRAEGVLILGSGVSYHDLRNFFQPSAGPVSRKFERWLTQTIESDPDQRRENLLHWEKGSGAREAHPREDHLVPIFALAGAAGRDPGKRIILDHTFGVDMASYRFGGGKL